MRIVKEKLQNGETRYLARPIVGGKKLAVSAATKGDVERQVAALKDRQRRRRLGLPDPDERRPEITYGELCERVLETYKHSPQSKQTLTYNLARSKTAFARVGVHELLPENIDAWLSRLALSTTTKRHTLKAMRYALRRAQKWGYRPDNPAEAVEMPPEPEYQAHPFESWQEVRRAVAAFTNPRDRALVLFACATGLRPQEWRALRWQDVDRKERTLRVNRTVQDGAIVESKGKTRGALRTVLLDDSALEALASLPTPLQRDQLVFPGRSGGVLDLHKWRAGPWRRALTAAKLAYREPSGMRDTFATLNLTDGAPLEWISKQLGHSELDTTIKHYARWQRVAEYRILDELNARRSATGLKADSDAAEAK